MFHGIQKFQKCRSNFIFYGNLTSLNIQTMKFTSLYTLHHATTIAIARKIVKKKLQRKKFHVKIVKKN